MRKLFLIVILGMVWGCAPPERTPPELVLPWQEVRPSLSFDGSKVAFEADRHTRLSAEPRAFGRRRAGFPNIRDILVWNREEATLKVLSLSPAGQPANADSSGPRLDAEGRRVVFASEASNLIERDGNANADVFLVDLEKGSTQRVPTPVEVPGQGSGFRPEISQDGSRVAFASYGVYRRSRDTNRSLVVYDGASGESRHVEQQGSIQGRPAFSPKGDRLAWGVTIRKSPEDPYSKFFKTVKSGTELKAPFEVFGSPDQIATSPALAESGCAFLARPSDGRDPIYHLYFRAHENGQVTQIDVGADDDSFEPAISNDGRFLVFSSYATNLVAGDDNGVCDVFCHDRETGETRLISQGSVGAPSNGPSFNPTISGDGRWVAFASLSSNLVEGASPGQVYLWDRVENRLEMVPVSPKTQ